MAFGGGMDSLTLFFIICLGKTQESLKRCPFVSAALKPKGTETHEAVLEYPTLSQSPTRHI